MSFVLFHALFQICFILGSGEPAATFSQSCPLNPPKRASTTAEGFAHDLLMQEQQLLAKESQLSEGLAALTTKPGLKRKIFSECFGSSGFSPHFGCWGWFLLVMIFPPPNAFPRCKAKITGELLLARRRLDEGTFQERQPCKAISWVFVDLKMGCPSEL